MIYPFGFPQMSIGTPEIARASSDLLRVLQREKIQDFRDILRMKDAQVFVDERAPTSVDGSVEFDIYQPLEGASALIIDYRLPPFGGLIELRLNKAINETKSILRCNSNMQGYSNICKDIYGNLGQIRVIPSASIDAVKSELERLSAL